MTNPEDALAPEPNYSKSEIVPFAPLHREIGVSFVEEEEYRELDVDRQKKIFNWVELIDQPYDMIQRAEGWTSPEKVYHGGQEKAVKYNEQTPKERSVTYGKAGRAAVRRHYRTTYDHYEIAQERYEAGKKILRKLRHKLPFGEIDSLMVNEILQELANGVAANLDDRFPGGDVYARIAGNSILHEIDRISQIGEVPSEFTSLISAGVNYIAKQREGWIKAISATELFAKQKDFPLTREQPKV